jgi:hypothetical protein
VLEKALFYIGISYSINKFLILLIEENYIISVYSFSFSTIITLGFKVVNFLETSLTVLGSARTAFKSYSLKYITFGLKLSSNNLDYSKKS